MPPFSAGIWIGPNTTFSLALRTARALTRLGIASERIHWVRSHRSDAISDAINFGTISIKEFLNLARHRQQSAWLLDAGAWPVYPIPFSILEAISNQKVIAFGVVKSDTYGLAPSDARTKAWERSDCKWGPSEETSDWLPQDTHAWSSIFVPSGMMDSLHGLETEVDFRTYLRDDKLNAAKGRIAGIRIDGLDVRIDHRLRIAQVITSLQRGGAERIALDLHHYWLRQGIHAALCAIDSPRREAFPYPPCFVHYFDRNHRDNRVDACVRFVERFQPDVVHTHLLSRNEHQAFSCLGFPSMTTLHNMPQGWPRGFDQTRGEDVDLAVSCAKAIERIAIQELPDLEHRTVWNGISGRQFRMESELRANHRARMRKHYGIHDDDWVILALANPRPQKRLERIPGIVSSLQRKISQVHGHRRVHAVFAGEASSSNTLSQESSRQLDAEIEALGLVGVCHRAGSIAKVEEVLAAADVLISCSEYEGLSLAHLESLASGLPVVATDVGGNREIASWIAAMHLVGADGDVHEFADVISRILETRDRGQGKATIELHRTFETYTMGRGYHRMVRGLLSKASRATPEGLWLVTNNFSVGGAQSSARRMLEKLHERGRKVHAAVLEENPSDPTPGTQWLRSKGIPVFPVPSPTSGQDYSTGVQASVDALLDAIDRQPPEAVVFWNTIPVYKLLLVDGLVGVPVYDVSPGEMNLASLEACIADGVAGLPYQSTMDYGARLRGAVVKYCGERLVAEKAFGMRCPVSVIPNGVPNGVEKTLRQPKNVIRIGTSTRLNPHKRVEDLLDALRELKPEHLARVELWIAGGVDGALESYAEHLRRYSAGLPVHWLGNVTDIAAFLRDLDMFVMISEPAGCPNAILEAMSVGLPVIATDVGGAAEMVVHQECGIIVPPRSAIAMANAIAQLLSAPEIRDRFGKAARARAISKYSLERMADDYERLFFGSHQ